MRSALGHPIALAISLAISLGTSLVILTLMLLATAGCTTTGKSYLPIDSQLRPWQPSEDSAAPASTSTPSAEKKGKK
jgi:hypothetical protein